MERLGRRGMARSGEERTGQAVKVRHGTLRCLTDSRVEARYGRQVWVC